MNQNYIEYHLHHKHEDLLQERDQDRLAALAAVEQQPGLLRRLFAKSTQVAKNLTETETSPTACTDVRLA